LGEDFNVTLITVIVVTGVLICSLVALVITIIVRKSHSNDADSSVSMLPLAHSSTNHYTKIEVADSEQSVGKSSIGNCVATSAHINKSGGTKSWEINYAELQMLETVGEGAFGTVHKAIFRHQQVAVKQLKNQIDQREV
jgi:predicted ATPase